MEKFSMLLALCAGNSTVTGEFPAQRPVTQSFDVFFDLCLINAWVNNCEAGDLRWHRAHYDVIVVSSLFVIGLRIKGQKWLDGGICDDIQVKLWSSDPIRLIDPNGTLMIDLGFKNWFLRQMTDDDDDDNDDLWLWPTSSRSFRHDLAIKMLKYGTSCVRCTAHTVLNGFFLYLAQMIISIRGCVVQPLTLTYIIKGIQQCICNKTAILRHNLSCPLYSMYSSGWILSLFGSNDH